MRKEFVGVGHYSLLLEAIPSCMFHLPSLVPRLPSFMLHFAWPPNEAGKPGNKATTHLGFPHGPVGVADNSPWQRQTSCKEEGWPVDSVEPEDVLADQVDGRRPAAVWVGGARHSEIVD